MLVECFLNDGRILNLPDRSIINLLDLTIGRVTNEVELIGNIAIPIDKEAIHDDALNSALTIGPKHDQHHPIPTPLSIIALILLAIDSIGPAQKLVEEQSQLVFAGVAPVQEAEVGQVADGEE